MRDWATGLRSAIASWWSAWPAILMLAGGELLLAVLGALPGRGAVASTIGQRPAILALAGGDWLNVLADFMTATPKAFAPGQDTAALSSAPESALTLAMLATALSLLLAVVLHGLLYNFASGAALEHMSRGQRSFWRAGTLWFWPMFRLGIVVVVVALALGGIAAFVLALLPGGDLALLALKLAAWLILMALLGSLFELTRATMVVGHERSWRRGIRRALRIVAARPALTFGLWFALTAVSWALTAAVAALTLGTTATEMWTAWMIAALAIAVGSGFKLFRLAAQRQLAGGTTIQPVGGVEDRP